MELPGADTAVVRYGELYTKSDRVSGWMEQQLAGTLEALLTDRGIDGTVDRRPGRPLIRTTEPSATLDAATDAFGVVSAGPALSVEPEREAIEAALARVAVAAYDGGTFAVRARRGADDLPFTSDEIEEFGGSAVRNAVEDEIDPAVDLDDPDYTFRVDARRGQNSGRTAQNLGATSSATDLPIHRPLLSMDETEISERAREIGTYADSTIPAG